MKIQYIGKPDTAFALKFGEKKTPIKNGDTVEIEKGQFDALSAYHKDIKVILDAKTTVAKREKAVVKPSAVRKSSAKKTEK